MSLAEAPSLGIAAALGQARAAGPVVGVTVAVPAVDAWLVARAAVAGGMETACWSRPSEGLAIVGIGRAWASESGGRDRFTAAEVAWGAVAAGLSSGGAVARGPLLIGGLGFVGDRPADGSTWRGFPVASMVLPQLTVTIRDGAATLGACVSVVDRDRDAGILEATWALLAEAASRAGPIDAAGARPLRSGSRPDRATWDRLVALMAGAVGRGRLDKVVLARQVDLVLDRAVDPVGVFTALSAAAPESAAFLFHRAGRTFVGATPERLARVEGRAFRTAAVAGSARRGVGPEEDAGQAAALLASDKDREEHAVVVDALRAGLAPVATELRVAATPSVLALADVLHLVTPIDGLLRERTGVLSLAGLLHPTPAVGGSPTAQALVMLGEHEGFERGWYAGPVGWVGADGDGELMVALRCGVLDGAAASLFAGCGIVADSDPAREWAESRLKLRPMLHALGVSPESVA